MGIAIKPTVTDIARCLLLASTTHCHMATRARQCLDTRREFAQLLLKLARFALLDTLMSCALPDVSRPKFRVGTKVFRFFTVRSNSDGQPDFWSGDRVDQKSEDQKSDRKKRPEDRALGNNHSQHFCPHM